MNNGLWIQDHAHASTKPLFHPDSLHYGASTWAKTCNNWFLCHVPEFPLKPTNLYHAARWKIAALCLMLECVSILAGILVVSGPSKLEFGDVWGKDIICKVYIYMCVCELLNYYVYMHSLYFVYSMFIFWSTTNVSSTSCWNETLARWRWVSVPWCGFKLMRSNGKSIFLLDGQLSLYDIIWHLVTLWMVQRCFSRAKAPDTVYMCTQMNGESMRRFKRARR